ncbi:hypothetical protein SLEP1_g25006 [Rubroshorea leprosula]|uniref:Uncharacterized protein n=1 Tax=Rubroshorea leprosula TaxID=152421 RepID=A0AAV5JTL7_9ROSI|nr:hypothetical protein SLEP1_g25006 [Rubroshorea leprosula]
MIYMANQGLLIEMEREAQSEGRGSYAVSRKAVAETPINRIYGNREDIEHVSGRVSKDFRGKDFPMVINLDGVGGTEHDYCVALPADELDLAVKRMEHIICRGSPLTPPWDKVLDSLGFKRACGTFRLWRTDTFGQGVTSYNTFGQCVRPRLNNHFR